jgi:hypothetical protein
VLEQEAPPLSRRDFLRVSGGALGALVLWTTPAAAGVVRHPGDLDRFLQLSRLVTGVEHLSASLAAQYYEALDPRASRTRRGDSSASPALPAVAPLRR